MRSLNTSLPGASPPKQQGLEPPEQLLQAFKAAALSVTKLYKTAAADQTRARSEGYQDALDDLLAFLDKEDIGLNDGEGWKIRRWATERLDGRDGVSQNNESDEEADKAERGSSPVLQRAQSVGHLPTRSVSPVRTGSATPTVPVSNTEQPMLPPTGAFTFRSSHPLPQDTDITLGDLDLSDNNRGQTSHESSLPRASSNAGPGITITRPSRTNSRHNNLSSRLGTRGSTSSSRSAGQKRKINYGDFFDISNLGHGKDGFGGGGKRGRHA